MNRILRHVGNKDFKRTRQRQIDEQKECAAQKLKEQQKEELERKQIEEAAKPYRSNWREEINLQESEWSAISGSGPTNSAPQSFQYGGDGGPTATFSGLGGVEAYPSTVTIDYGFGETEVVSTPTYSQLAMQGYAKPLGGVQRQTQQIENEKIDAEIRKLEEQIKQLDQKRSDLENEQLETEPQYTGMTPEEYADRDNEIGEKWADKMWPLQKKLNDNPECIAADKCTGTKAALFRMSEQMIKEHEDLYNEYMSQTKAYQKAFDAHFSAYDKKFDSIRKEKEALRAKIVELEKQRPINQQLDASQQAYPNLPMMGARVQPVNLPRLNVLGDRNLSIQPTNPVYDTLAKVGGVETAKNFVDHYIDNFVLGDQKQDQNLTKLLTKDDRQYLEKELRIKDMQNNFTKILRGKIDSQTKINQINAAVRQVLEDGPEGIQNSLGRGATLDIEYFKKTGDFKLDKKYQFTSKDDLGYRSGDNLMSNFKSLFTKGYTSGKMPGGDVSPLIQNPMRFHVIIRGPKRKKKEEEEVVESTWSRLKKHR